MNYVLRNQILECLYRHRQAVTFGALGGLVNSIPRSVMRGLPKNHRNSWVINSRTLLPPGYQLDEIDPNLLNGNAVAYVIRTPAGLQQWLIEKGCYDINTEVTPSVVSEKANVDLESEVDVESIDIESEWPSDEEDLTINDGNYGFSCRLLIAILKEVAKTVPGIGQLITVLEGMELDDNIQDLQTKMVWVFDELARIKETIKNENLINLQVVKGNTPSSIRHVSTSPGRRNVFLYLASSARASALVTEQIAIDSHFIWRSYFNVTNKSVANVQYVKENDIVVLAYRDSHPIVPGRFFRVLSPFVVTGPRDNMQINPVAPFGAVQDDQNLIATLNQNGYHNDPILNSMIGLPVEITDANLDSPEAMNVFANAPWPSPPGMNTLWPLYRPNANWQESHYIPEPVKAWMRTLLNATIQ